MYMAYLRLPVHIIIIIIIIYKSRVDRYQPQTK